MKGSPILCTEQYMECTDVYKVGFEYTLWKDFVQNNSTHLPKNVTTKIIVANTAK